MGYSNPDFNQEEAKKLWESLLSEASPSDEQLVSAVKNGQYYNVHVLYTITFHLRWGICPP